jgi:hypothetical protein
MKHILMSFLLLIGYGYRPVSLSAQVNDKIMTTESTATVVLKITTQKGNVGRVDGVPVWKSSDTAVLTPVATADGLSAELKAGVPGTVKVRVEADADLSTGVRIIFTEFTVTVKQAEASNIEAIITIAMRVPPASDIKLVSVTPQQVIIAENAPDNQPCKIELREGASGPLAEVTDPTLFPGADLDTTHNVLPAGRLRLLRIGLRTARYSAAVKVRRSLSLAAMTDYRFMRTCGGVTDTLDFRTPAPKSLVSEALPTDDAAWGRQAFPEFDFAALDKPVTDPKSGLKLYTNDPGKWAWTQPVGVMTSLNIGSQPAILAADTTAWNDQTSAFGGYWPEQSFVDAALELKSLKAARVRVAISLDSGQTPYTEWITADLAADTASLVPQSYPRAYFSGWSKKLPMKAWPNRRGIVNTDGQKITLQIPHRNPGAATFYFDPDWKPGTKIEIGGILYTIDRVENHQTLYIRETLPVLTGIPYKSAHFAFMIASDESLTLTARPHFSRGRPPFVTGGGCHQKPITTSVSRTGAPLGRTLTGWSCMFPAARQERVAWWAIFRDGNRVDIRLVSHMANPLAYLEALPGHTLAETPSPSYEFWGPSARAIFDSDDPRVAYSALPTYSAAAAIMRGEYTGDWRETTAGEFKTAQVAPLKTSEIKWENVLRGIDLSKLVASSTPYRTDEYGTVNADFIGITGKYFVLKQQINQDRPGWLFLLNRDTKTIDYYLHTLTGEGLPADAGISHAGIHAAGVLSPYGAITLSLHPIKDNPYSGRVTAVHRSDGTWNTTDTSVSWPPNPLQYDIVCPADLDPKWKAAAGMCLTVRVKHPGATATAAEALRRPYPGDTTKMMAVPWREGAMGKDIAALASTAFDNEGVLFARVKTISADEIEAVLVRNANTSYCGINGPDKVGIPAQATHRNGWSLTAAPRDSCYALNAIWDIAAGKVHSINFSSTRGHSASKTEAVGVETWLGNAEQYEILSKRTWARTNEYRDWTVANNPMFAGKTFDIANLVQSYPRIASEQHGLDMRHHNGWLGQSWEIADQRIGQPTGLIRIEGNLYRMRFSGAYFPKHNVIQLWAGDTVLTEISSPDRSKHTITPSDTWRFSYALRDGEGRMDSKAGDLFMVIPGLENINDACWASQMNLRTPCAIASLVGGQVLQFRLDAEDKLGDSYRSLGTLLMGPAQQYVYSSVMAVPDGSIMCGSGFFLGGYHNGLLCGLLPPDTSLQKPNTFLPIEVSYTGTNVYVEYGLEEYGDPMKGELFCTPRREPCRVSTAVIDENNPFRFAYEGITPVSGTGKIVIPSMPDRIVFFRLVTDGVPGPVLAH